MLPERRISINAEYGYVIYDYGHYGNEIIPIKKIK